MYRYPICVQYVDNIIDPRDHTQTEFDDYSIDEYKTNIQSTPEDEEDEKLL